MMTFRVRPAVPGDREFLRALFEQSLDERVGAMPLPEPLRTQTIDMLFASQTASWTQGFPDSVQQIVLTETGERAGRLWRAEEPHALRIVDLSIGEAMRGRGLASALIRSLQAEAARRGLALLASVRLDNPARALWGRLGFEEGESDGVIVRLRCGAPGGPPPMPSVGAWTDLRGSALECAGERWEVVSVEVAGRFGGVSIVLRAPPGSPTQGTRRFARVGHGEFEWLVVPIGEDAEGVLYQAVIA
jgi:ribosomal protein S18 acetylase RimI-like enzyme